MDGIAASNFIVQEDEGLALDAVTTERIKYMVRTRWLVQGLTLVTVLA